MNELNVYLEITYFFIEVRSENLSRTGALETRAGGSGSSRVWLVDLPEWLASRPGTLIVSMRKI